MIKESHSRVPFAELPSEARALFTIFGLAAAAKFQSQSPTRSELAASLGQIWDQEHLSQTDLSDPFRMTKLLEKHFAASSITGTTDGPSQRGEALS